MLAGVCTAPLVGAAVIATAFAGTSTAAAPPSTGPACGAATAGVIYALDDAVVHKIYNDELHSAEVKSDLADITSSTTLAEAVALGNQNAVRAATHAIVYTPHWHIVRLRVLTSSGTILADVGGPDILAPLTGQITYKGSVVGSFVMSVQDDLGYTKLVAAIAGVPIELYLQSDKPLMGSVKHPPSSPPPAGPLTLGRVDYTVDAYTLESFPQGELHVAVLIPAPSTTLSAMSCPEVRMTAVAAVVEHVAIGLTNSGFSFLDHTGLFIDQASGYARSPIFVLDGKQEIAGTNNLSGGGPSPPRDLPDSGQVTYEGTQWLVQSFERYPPDRVYVLQPTTQPVSSGPTGAS